jgi:hypothetical protein
MAAAHIIAFILVPTLLILGLLFLTAWCYQRSSSHPDAPKFLPTNHVKCAFPDAAGGHGTVHVSIPETPPHAKGKSTWHRQSSSSAPPRSEGTKLELKRMRDAYRMLARNVLGSHARAPGSVLRHEASEVPSAPRPLNTRSGPISMHCWDYFSEHRSYKLEALLCLPQMVIQTL